MATGREVVLSGGTTVTVRPVRWLAWQNVKEAFARLLGSRLVPEVISLALKVGGTKAEGEGDGEGDGDDLTNAAVVIADWYGNASVEKREGLAELLIDAIRTSGDLAAELIQGCVADAGPINDLTAADFFDLASASIEESDLRGLLGREKNFWTQVLAGATSGMKPPTGTHHDPSLGESR